VRSLKKLASVRPPRRRHRRILNRAQLRNYPFRRKWLMAHRSHLARNDFYNLRNRNERLRRAKASPRLMETFLLLAAVGDPLRAFAHVARIIARPYPGNGAKTACPAKRPISSCLLRASTPSAQRTAHSSSVSIVASYSLGERNPSERFDRACPRAT